MTLLLLCVCLSVCLFVFYCSTVLWALLPEIKPMMMMMIDVCEYLKKSRLIIMVSVTTSLTESPSEVVRTCDKQYYRCICHIANPYKILHTNDINQQ